MNVQKRGGFKSCEGKRKRTAPKVKKMDTEQSDRMVPSQKDVATEVRSVGGKIIKEETIVSTEKQKAKYTTVTSMGTQTEEGNRKEEVVEEKVWKKDAISCNWETGKDCRRKRMKNKAVGLDESSMEYDVTTKREVMDAEETVIKVKREKTSKRTMAEESEINELLTGGNASGHKTRKRKKQRADRASKRLERDTRGVKENTMESKVRAKERGLGGAENPSRSAEDERRCLGREWGWCEALTPVQGPRERDVMGKRGSEAAEAEWDDAERWRPRRSQENVAGTAADRADERLLKKRKKWPERGLVETRAAEEKVKMHKILLELPTSHAEVVFLSEKLGNRDEVVIDQARRLALQREIDLASC
ncbi:uncharacterized protein [Paramormyrops kingsleyae]|uniref:uncharacterized protein n=1 Tax=Paramormyrops kingsleyae TaxID=1676925 RepID=UPI003B9706DD